ncbi:DUF6252 family protein [uncultured Flavobacterium sp.]|uniref:DUF6252 family protein n=1 Tax=uncultured Flavobacterium sp. TaxID=165435 RepID=UPI0030EBCEAF|tara:strand:+ start:221483 stop:222355 length:873 start_codon:yes stop_codon:yes gene_type:complete
MKHLKLILFIALTISVFSCSSDSDNDPQSATEYFNYTDDNEVLSVTSWQAFRSENSLAVTASTSQGKSLQFEFNAQGNLGSASTYSSDFSIPSRYSQAYYSQESFNFEMVNFDETNKTIEVNFSGKIYEDEHDLSSPYVNISGSFLVKYTVIIPSISGLKMGTKIDNVDWYSSSEDQEGGFFPGSDIRLNFYNSDKNNIAIIVNQNNTTASTYTFTSNSTNNKAILSVYNTATDYHDDYNCSGTLTITEKTVGSQLTVLAGTFSFTATNPVNSNQTQVTNGTFKTVYSNY